MSESVHTPADGASIYYNQRNLCATPESQLKTNVIIVQFVPYLLLILLYLHIDLKKKQQQKKALNGCTTTMKMKTQYQWS